MPHRYRRRSKSRFKRNVHKTQQKLRSVCNKTTNSTPRSHGSRLEHHKNRRVEIQIRTKNATAQISRDNWSQTSIHHGKRFLSKQQGKNRLREQNTCHRTTNSSPHRKPVKTTRHRPACIHKSCRATTPICYLRKTQSALKS